MKRNPKDFWTGLLYLFFGASAIMIARDYSMGTAVRMGPAYFPTILGALLALVGAISMARSFIVPGTPIGGFAFKGLALVTVAVLVFGLLVREAGLIVACLCSSSSAPMPAFASGGAPRSSCRPA